MGNKIEDNKKPLDLNKIKSGLYQDDTIDKKTILYESVVETQDPVSGEITAKSSNKLIKKPKTPDFIQMYTKGMVGLFDINVSKDQMRVLFKILHKYVLPSDNRIMLNKEIKDEISLELNVTINTINHALGALHREQVLLKRGRGSYFLNPFIFGKGKFDDIAKLRYTVKHEYDFEKGQMSIERERTAHYQDNEKEGNGYQITHANEETTHDEGYPHLKQDIEVEDTHLDEEPNEIDPDDYYIDEELKALKELEDHNKLLEKEKYSGEDDRRKSAQEVIIDAKEVSSEDESELEKMRLKVRLEELELAKIEKQNESLKMQLELEHLKQENK